ncbi:MAG: gamma-glutamyltransferase family protein [Granulosicoccus sp.]
MNRLPPDDGLQRFHGMTSTWEVSKPQLESHGGIVAAQHFEAAQVGAGILHAGGNAMDAAIATALALSVVEPWLSGLGGGGFLLHADAQGVVDALNFTMRAPLAADTADYPLVGGDGGDWFDWPSVQDDRNLVGPFSICVPGAVAGLASALERHGSLSWDAVLQPAIALAERGMRVDWFAELAFSIDRDGLLKNSHAKRLFLDPDSRIHDPADSTLTLLPMPAQAKTLRALAEKGSRDFYEGQMAELLVNDLRTVGSAITLDDMARYEPVWSDTLSAVYRDRIIHTIPGLSGGPSLLSTFAELSGHEPGDTDEAGFAALHADAIRNAYTSRLQSMGHAATIQDCTTHLCVIDNAGNMVSLTNTLLSRFGSKVVAPSLGLTMNNGMMWFDPRPGQPNSIAGGASPLTNMSPAITMRDGKPEIAIGAAGGRQIFPAVAQILSRIIDKGESPEAAIHAPRIDASTPTIRINRRATPDTASRISINHPVQIVEDTLYPVQFAIPTLVKAGSHGAPNIGVVHPNNPWTCAVSDDAS